MKKVYEAPSVEKVEFQYRDQVVVASGDDGARCTQDWAPGTDSSLQDNNCSYTVVVPDSGLH